MAKTSPIEPILRRNILILAKACAKARGVKLSTLSGEAHGDPRVLERLMAKKGSITIRKYDSMMAYFDKHWPEDAPKPPIRIPFESLVL